MFSMIGGNGNAIPSSLGSISIPSTITSIGNNSYNLDSIVLNYSIKIVTYCLFWILIGYSAFAASGSLSQVTLVSGLTVIGKYMFYGADGNGNLEPSSLGSISIPSTIISIGKPSHICISTDYLFAIYHVSNLGVSAFQSCGSLSKITLVSGLTILGDNMFQMIYGVGNSVISALDSITIPSTVTSIGKDTYV